MLITLFGTPEPDYSIPLDRVPFERDLKTAFKIYKSRLEDWQKNLLISTTLAFISVLVVLNKSWIWPFMLWLAWFFIRKVRFA